MRQPTIEQLLIAAVPAQATYRSDFTLRTMQRITRTQPEIFRASMRKMSVTNKETFMLTLLRQPKLALIAMAIGATLLIGGTAYAAYRLWEAPRAHTNSTHINEQGRTEVAVDLQHCGDAQKGNFEIKHGSTVAPHDVAKVVQAACELNAIDNWAQTQWGNKNDRLTQVTSSFSAYALQELGDSQISFRYSPTETWTLPVTEDTKYIVNGHFSTKHDFKKDDTIAYVTRNTYATTQGGAPTSRTALAIIKLDLPANYYATELQNQVSQRTPCTGNTQDSCGQGASIDVFPRNEGLTLPYASPQGESYVIEGEITSYNGATFTLKGSSGTTYTVTAIEDIFANFNTQHSQAYGGIKVELGDRVVVHYAQASNADHTKVGPQQIRSVALMLELQDKNDPLHKY